ncbi:MAG: tetratricopeptide repeat protein [Gammaproteobacteria bacterium]
MIKTRYLEQPIRSRQPLWPLAAACVLLALSPHTHSDEVSEEVGTHIMQAEEALQSSDYETAASEYRQAAELSDDPEIAQQATRIAYSYGFNKDGLESAERWTKLDPDNEEALLYVAQLNLRLGKIRDSRRVFEKLLERNEEGGAERLLALIPFLSQEDQANAYELMRQLARPYKDSPEAHYAVAVMALQAGETEIAGERAQEAIALDDEWIKPHLLYARSLLLQGDEEGAIDYTSRLVGDSPDPDPEARLELAIMLLSADREDDALSQVNQILLEQPSRSDALRLMAIINFRQDHLDVAKADFEDLLASGYYTMDALYYLGRIADRRLEQDQAIHYYSQVTRGSNATISQRRAAVIMSQQGDTDEALRHLDDFAETNPSHAVDMLQAKAQLLYSVERYPEALEYYDKVVKYRPDSEGSHLGRAELLLRMGRIDDSLDQYAVAVRRWPDSSMSLNAYGYTLADRTDRYDEARKLIRKALDINPESAAIIDSWGWVLYKQGEYEEALKYLQQAYERLRDPEVAAHIFEVMIALEREDEAMIGLVEAESLFPDSQILKDVRERFVADSP